MKNAFPHLGGDDHMAYTDPVQMTNLMIGSMRSALILGLIFYAYMAWALMTIARRLNEPAAWLAWIPIANLWLFWKLTGTEQWSFWIILAGTFLGFIPFFGMILVFLSIIIFFWWGWVLAERLGKPGALVLLNLIPILGPLIYWGILAWT